MTQDELLDRVPLFRDETLLSWPPAGYMSIPANRYAMSRMTVKQVNERAEWLLAQVPDGASVIHLAIPRGVDGTLSFSACEGKVRVLAQFDPYTSYVVRRFDVLYQKRRENG